MRRYSAVVLKPLLIWIALFVFAPFAHAQTAATMREVYDAIAYLLPLSVRDPSGGSEWDHELINGKFELLKSASSELAKHGASTDSEFKLIAQSFEQSVARAESVFRQSWQRYGLFALQELTAHCVSCHTRLPAHGQQWFGEKLRARMPFTELSPREQVGLLVATRNFDTALDIAEKTLGREDLRPIEADYQGLPVIYLRIALATEGSLSRLDDFLARYAARDDMPIYLKMRYQEWRDTLKKHDAALNELPDLMYARAAFADATGRSQVPGNRARVVDDLVAARIMRDWLAENPDAAAAVRAEIYYSLGVIALRTHESEPAIPDMELLLVACIQAEPGGEYARMAYLLLEEYGFVHDQGLAEQLEGQILIDMEELKRAAGFNTP